MKEYLKMADYFVEGGVSSGDVRILDGVKRTIIYSCEEAAAHAINSHDELVENMLHYKREDEQWEARATNEASRAQDLQAEVEALTELCERFSTFCEDVGDFMGSGRERNSVRNDYIKFKQRG